MDPPNRKPNFILITLFFINFLIPRFFGLIPLRQNTKSLCLEKSRLWLVFCIFTASAFIFFYPSSLQQITSHSSVDTTSVSQYVEKMHFMATYVLAVAIYARQVFYSEEMMHFINDGIRIYFLCEPIVHADVGVREFMIPYIFRAFYSYLGYASMNYFSFVFIYKNAKNMRLLYKVLFFIPDFVVTSCCIRFHSTILMLTISFRRLNAAFRECIIRIHDPNAVLTLNLANATSDDISDQFHAVVDLHQELFRMSKEVEKQLSNTILFSICNSFMNLTSTVSIGMSAHRTFGFNSYCPCFSAVFPIFVIFGGPIANLSYYIHIHSFDSICNRDCVHISTVQCTEERGMF